MRYLRLILIFVFLGTLINDINMAVLDVNKFFNVNGNLSIITWAHAVNNASLLTEALNNYRIMMLEADVVLGNLAGTNVTNIPIMAHPPANTSSLTLETFFNTFASYNVVGNVTRKGLKLDFKSIEAFVESVKLLVYWIPKLNCPVWLNADILNGPLNATALPVNPTNFFAYSRIFTDVTLSIGWTTNYVQSVNTTTYTSSHITNMLNTLSTNNVTHSITFPVRAFIAAQSIPQMETLLNSVSGSTLTVWTGDGDPVNINSLQTLIRTVGVNKTYVDLPDALMNQLNLGTDAASPASVLSIWALLAICLLLYFA